MEYHTNSREKLLISDLKNGSYKAFDAIYEMYARRLYAYCLQFTKSVEDSEDIVQEVFINLWKSKSSIRQNDTLESFLFVIAKHRLINAYRSKLNSIECRDDLEQINSITVDDTANQIECGDLLQQFTKVLSKMPITQQRVIQLSRFKKLSNKEIAETLSLSEQTVKNQLSIGLKTLREKLPKAGVLFMLL